MSSAQGDTRSSGPQSQPEELDVVMGRFKSWTETRLEQAVVGRGAASKTRPALHANIPSAAGKPAEAWEVSYEEALRRSSYRRYTDSAVAASAVPPEAIAGGKPIAAPGKPLKVARSGFESENGKHNPAPQHREKQSRSSPASRDGNPPAERAVSERPATVISRSAPAVDAQNEGSLGSSQLPQVDVAATELKTTSKRAHAAPAVLRSAAISTETSRPARAAKGRKTSSERRSLQKAARSSTPYPSVAALSGQVSAAPASSTLSGAASRSAVPIAAQPDRSPAAASVLSMPDVAPARTPAFQEVLRETAALAAKDAKPEAAAIERGKSIALSMRVTEAEQSRIQASAAQANLTVSAYLRQCALQVDELRTQVQTALAKLEEKAMQPQPPSSLAATPALWQRFTTRFRRLWRRPNQGHSMATLR